MRGRRTEDVNDTKQRQIRMKEMVNIIGAGPAGLASAIVLRRHGIPVRVFEQDREVGSRFSGDFQGLENWSSEKGVMEVFAELGIEMNFEYAPYYVGTVVVAGMEPLEVKSDRPFFYLVKRGAMPGSLDTALKAQALGLGAEIFFGKRFEKFEGKAIVATGPKGGDIIAAGITFDTDTEDRAIVAFDDRMAPKGYAYLLINQGRGTIATVVYQEFRKAEYYSTKALMFFRDQLKIDVRNEKRFGGYGNFFLRETQVRHGKLFIGEAAGFQDCLWGFGIRYAVLSGYLAARSIIEGSDYDALWKLELKSMLETSLVNRYLFQKIGQKGYNYLSKRFANGSPRVLLKSHYNRSFMKHLLFRPATRQYKSRVKDRVCNHEDCACVWCRCVKKHAHNSRIGTEQVIL